MRLLVVSFAFPPYNSIGGLRVGKTVKYLLKLGNDVRVLTARDQPFPPTLPLEIPAQNIIYTHSFKVRKSTEITTLKRGVNGPAGNNRTRTARLAATLKQGLRYSLRTLVYFPDANVGWLPYAVTSASRLFQKWKPDLILASSPPPTSLLVASRLSKRFHIPWIADLRDLWVDQQYYNQPAWRKSIENRLERRILSSAVGLVTVSEPLSETLKKKYGKPTAVVRNGFDPVDYPPHSEVPFRDGQIRIVYTGLIYEGRQDPTPLFQALKELGPLAERVRVAFYGGYYGNNQDGVRSEAARHGVEHLVEINGMTSYADSLKNQTEADVLLLLLWNDPRQRGVYTGKLFEYIGARRPILAVGESDNVAAQLIAERGLGVVANEPVKIAAQLKRWLEQKQKAGAIPSLPEDNMAGMSREEQTSVLEEYLYQFKGSSAVEAVPAEV